MTATLRKTSARKVASTKKKLFVLDTNVLLHDPNSLFKFQEHDLFIPFVTIEELDNKKAGNLDVNRNARQATRLMEAVVSQARYTMKSGYPLNKFNGGSAKGRLFVQGKSLPFLPDEFARKNDNLYLAVLQHLQETTDYAEVVMVTKDLNLRIKARALGFVSEDYRHDHVVEDVDLIHKGLRFVDSDWLEGLLSSAQSWKDAQDHHYRYAVAAVQCLPNEFLCTDHRILRVDRVRNEEGLTVLAEVADRRKPKNAVAGIVPRSTEQAAALELLLNDDIDMVALLGPAGTGKTLLAVAAGLHQIEAHSRFEEIIFTRATVALGEDIGFLPGGEEEKLSPWLGGLYDNIDVLVGLTPGGDIEKHRRRELAKSTVKIRAITFMRGRTFHQRMLVIDEAQNLTPKQVKALVTRAGENTKLVLLGNLAQIDTPYLTESSSGLAYAVERFKNWPHFGSLILDKGERSRLASAGNDLL